MLCEANKILKRKGLVSSYLRQIEIFNAKDIYWALFGSRNTSLNTSYMPGIITIQICLRSEPHNLVGETNISTNDHKVMG